MIICAIDPGVIGAFALLTTGGDINQGNLFVMDLPMDDEQAIEAMRMFIVPGCLMSIEKVRAMPGANNDKLTRSVAFWEGFAAAKGAVVSLVDARVWQSSMLGKVPVELTGLRDIEIGGEEELKYRREIRAIKRDALKERSVEVAMQLFPAAAPLLQIKRNETNKEQQRNRADALCLLAYAVKVYETNNERIRNGIRSN